MNQNLAYQEEWPEELIDGKVVAMSPRPAWNHVSIAGNLYTIFSNYLRESSVSPSPTASTYISQTEIPLSQT